MRLLLIDNSTQFLFLGLYAAAAGIWQKSESKWIAVDDEMRSDDNWLHRQVDLFFEQDSPAGFSRESIDGFAIGSGPGSFTGLRIAFAYFKTLALAWEKPLVSFSSIRFWQSMLGLGGEQLAFQANRNLFLLYPAGLDQPAESLARQELTEHFSKRQDEICIIWPPFQKTGPAEEIFLASLPGNVSFGNAPDLANNLPGDSPDRANGLLPAPDQLAGYRDGWKEALPVYGHETPYVKKVSL